VSRSNRQSNPPVPARKHPSRGEALGFSLSTIILVILSAGMLDGLVEGAWQLRSVIHTAYGVGLVSLTLWVSWRTVVTWRWRRSALSRARKSS
jgi:hypothetical protein